VVTNKFLKGTCVHQNKLESFKKKLKRFIFKKKLKGFIFKKKLKKFIFDVEKVIERICIY